MKSDTKQSSRAYTVLIVDDDPLVREFIEEILKQSNYSTLHACKGDEAISILKSKNVDLVVLDLLLPGRHGFDVCSEIRRIDALKNIPILIITAVYTKRKYSYQLKELGANAFVTKPFEASAFIGEVNRLLNARPS
ncbi:MAG: response regulator [bacterium]